MLLLVIDVVPHGFNRSRADGEGGISFLPGELRLLKGLLGPVRRVFFQVAHEVGQAMRGLESKEQMHVVRNAADAERRATQAMDHAAEVFVES